MAHAEKAMISTPEATRTRQLTGILVFPSGGPPGGGSEGTDADDPECALDRVEESLMIPFAGSGRTRNNPGFETYDYHSVLSYSCLHCRRTRTRKRRLAGPRRRFRIPDEPQASSLATSALANSSEMSP